MDVEKERDQLRDYMREIERHLKEFDSLDVQVVASPTHKTWRAVESLGEIREIVARAMCQHAPHQVFDAQCRTYRICTKCGAVLDDLTLR